MNVAGHKRRPPLHVVERALLWVLSVHVVFLPWAFGTRDSWSQSVSAGLGLVGFGLAIRARNYRDQLAPSGDFVLNPLPRLWRFAPFWLGLGLLIYMFAQALNPAWEFQQDAKAWWMRKVPHVDWLPTSTRTPFARFDLWREFIIYAAAWLTACSVWVGITRRRSLQILSAVLVGNAVVLAIVGIAHRLSGEAKMLWIRDLKNVSPFSGFAYRNHAGAYFAMIAALSLGLVVWHFFDGRKRMARSTPSAVWLVVTVLLLLTVVLTLSRGAVISAGIFAVCAAAAFVVIRSANPVQSTTPRIVTVMLVIGFIFALGFVARYVEFTALARRFQEMSQLRGFDPSVSGRVEARSAAWEMFQEQLPWGSGAGSFEYLFPQHISKFPEAWEGGRAFWRHAHIDWLEIPIELGIPGVLLIGGAYFWAVRRFILGKGWTHPVAVMVFLGGLQTLLHAVIDFPFQNPAILTTWWVMLIAALRWLEIDQLSEEAKSMRD